ncbi:MAG: hypothetical protein IK025_05150 [Bacteroidales bacterium]|nr:hypothetical protein [Bacteroidales bacterium]
MGKIKKGILGGFSGKTGTVVGGSWKGIEYMRSLATSVANPNTSAQITVRSNFKSIVQIMSKVNPVLKASDWNQAKKQSAFNAAVRINFDNAIVDDAIDFERLSFGEFSRAGLTDLHAAFENDDTNFSLDLTWVNDADGSISFVDDMVVVVIVRTSADGNYEETTINYLDAKREDEQLHISIGLVESFNDGDTFYAYVGAGHNPKKPKEIINIPAKNVVRFSAAASLRRAVNAGH